MSSNFFITPKILSDNLDEDEELSDGLTDDELETDEINLDEEELNNDNDQHLDTEELENIEDEKNISNEQNWENTLNEVDIAGIPEEKNEISEVEKELEKYKNKLRHLKTEINSILLD